MALPECIIKMPKDVDTLSPYMAVNGMAILRGGRKATDSEMPT